jgi:hypothetical protein
VSTRSAPAIPRSAGSTSTGRRERSRDRRVRIPGAHRAREPVSDRADEHAHRAALQHQKDEDFELGWYRDANALVNQYGVSGFGDMWKNGQWRPGLYPNFNNDTSKWLSDQLTNWQAAADPGSWEDSVKGFVSDPGNLLTLVSGGGLGGFTGGQALTGGDVGGGLKKDLTGLAIGAGLAQVLPAIGLSSVAPATEGAAGTMTAQEGAGWLGGGTDPAGNVVGPTGAAVGNGAGTRRAATTPISLHARSALPSAIRASTLPARA